MTTKDNSRKSAFAPIAPRINTELADRLIREADARKLAANGSVTVAKSQSQPAKESEVPCASLAHAEPVTINLEVTILSAPEKLSPAWGYIRPYTLGVTLNQAYEPARSAIATCDFAQLRWLTMLAIVQRLLGQHHREPAIKGITQHLWKLVERPESAFWDGCGVSYRLSKHPISEGIERLNLNTAGPQSFGQFTV
jgi:hypothetical protein